MKSFLCIGDAMIDVIVKMKSSMNLNSDTLSEISMHGGGAAANTATWLAFLGSKSYFAGRVGDDIAGANFVNELETFGVQHKLTKLPKESTGTVVVLVDEAGNRSMFPDSGANSGLSQADLPSLNEIDGAFLSGYALFNPASTEAVQGIVAHIRELQIPIYLDIASIGTMEAFGRESALKLLANFDGIFLNDSEAEYVSGSIDRDLQLARLAQWSELVVIKCGAAGAVAKVRDLPKVEQPAIQVEVRDTTGAGDAFAAGFLREWLESRDLSKALAFGVDVAAQCVATIGARPSVNPRE